MSFNESLLPVDPALLYTRNDPNDRRLGDAVLRDATQYPLADVVVLGCPQDEGVARNKGRVGAAEAPNEIRKALYRYPVTEFHEHLKLMDLGDVRIGPTLEETHDALHSVVRQLVRDGKKIVILGGGNDISFPDCSALTAEIPPVLVFNVDKHLDVRAVLSNDIVGGLDWMNACWPR